MTQLFGNGDLEPLEDVAPETLTSEETTALLQDVATQMQLGTLKVTVPKKIGDAIGRLVVNSDDPAFAFVSTLAMRLKILLQLEKDGPIKQAATDGTHLVVNPWWYDGLSSGEQAGVVAQACFHCCLHHTTRRGVRDAVLWSKATDLAINPLIIDSKIPIPADWIVPGQGDYAKYPKGLAAEDYYEMLAKNDPGQGEFSNVCCTLDAPQGKAGETESNWTDGLNEAIQNASNAKGNMPDSMARFVVKAKETRTDWRSLLRQFLQAGAKDDFTWAKPNRRFAYQGLYLPGVESDKMGKIVIAVDTSGSVDEKTLSIFGAEIESILSAYAVTIDLTILYCDAKIQHVQTWNQNDGDLVLEAKGGGGTDHAPVFEWVEEHASDAVAVICLTDLYTSFPDEQPEIPVLWCVYNNPKPEAPWGEIVPVDVRGE